MCARTDFKRDCPEMYGMLLKEHDIPPRRTLVTLGDDKILTYRQPTAVEMPLDCREFPFSPEGANQALNYLSECRIRAGVMFDNPADNAEMKTMEKPATKAKKPTVRARRSMTRTKRAPVRAKRAMTATRSLA